MSVQEDLVLPPRLVLRSQPTAKALTLLLAALGLAEGPRPARAGGSDTVAVTWTLHDGADAEHWKEGPGLFRRVLESPDGFGVPEENHYVVGRPERPALSLAGSGKVRMGKAGLGSPLKRLPRDVLAGNDWHSFQATVRAALSKVRGAENPSLIVGISTHGMPRYLKRQVPHGGSEEVRYSAMGRALREEIERALPRLRGKLKIRFLINACHSGGAHALLRSALLTNAALAPRMEIRTLSSAGTGVSHGQSLLHALDAARPLVAPDVPDRGAALMDMAKDIGGIVSSQNDQPHYFTDRGPSAVRVLPLEEQLHFAGAAGTPEELERLLKMQRRLPSLASSFLYPPTLSPGATPQAVRGARLLRLASSAPSPERGASVAELTEALRSNDPLERYVAEWGASSHPELGSLLESRWQLIHPENRERLVASWIKDRVESAAVRNRILEYEKAHYAPDRVPRGAHYALSIAVEDPELLGFYLWRLPAWESPVLRRLSEDPEHFRRGLSRQLAFLQQDLSGLDSITFAYLWFSHLGDLQDFQMPPESAAALRDVLGRIRRAPPPSLLQGMREYLRNMIPRKRVWPLSDSGWVERTLMPTLRDMGTLEVKDEELMRLIEEYSEGFPPEQRSAALEISGRFAPAPPAPTSPSTEPAAPCPKSRIAQALRRLLP